MYETRKITRGQIVPKIDVHKEAFFHYLGKQVDNSGLETLLSFAKAELDDEQPDILRIELNDTNRPDLWSTVGLARQLRSAIYQEIPDYPFFSSATNTVAHDNRVITVAPELEHIRPYIAGFVFHGRGITDDILKDLVQLQEKLTENYGRKRNMVAMGIYRAQDIHYPVRYRAVDPATTSFQPLGSEELQSLNTILDTHPKGIAYAAVLAPFTSYPFLDDSNSQVLSFPPVINSADLGRVEVGDDYLFVECTGTDIYAVMLSCSIVACAVADMSYTVMPVQVNYPYDTALGRSIVSPYYFQGAQQAKIEEVEKLLGQAHSETEIQESLMRMGISSRIKNRVVEADQPPYRNDYLHPVDLIEDIMIGNGLEHYKAEMPSDFTIGRISETESFIRKVKATMLGLGFQEMIFNYLVSRRDLIERIYPAEAWQSIDAQAIAISNPISENYEYIRFSILSSLLSAESISGNAVYPHAIFEVGKVASIDPDASDGVRSNDSLALFYASSDANFNTVHQHVSALLYYLNLEKVSELTDCDDPRFIPGRCAELSLHGGAQSATFGELHPRILEQWGIQMPSVYAEFNLNDMMLH